MNDSSTRPPDPFEAIRRDHALVLDRLARLESETLEAAGPLDVAPLRELVAHLQRQFATHMTAEDQVLYPALAAAFPEVRGSLDPLQADHAELRQMLVTLSTMLGRSRDRERDEQIQVLARDLADLLRLHIRREESVVLDVASRVLSRTELAAIVSGLDAWREPGAKPNPQAPEGL